jgi:ABC-2 type transport system permease protein
MSTVSIRPPASSAIAVRAGFARGGIEIRQTLSHPGALWNYLVPVIQTVVVIVFLRSSHVGGTNILLGAEALPGTLAVSLAFTALATLAQILVVDREDGTLLRAKATPHGISAYLIGKVVLVGSMTLIGLVVQAAAGLLLVDGLHLDVGGVLTLLWLLPLGFLATAPIGAAIGALVSIRSMGRVPLPVLAVIGISGIYTPISDLPGWLQHLGEVFPIYWLGLGLRSAFLPGGSSVELHHGWQQPETFAVLAAWSVLGLLAAPLVLRRMARKESGSVVAQRRERALSRGNT